MPDPPPTSILTRYIFEMPWPFAAALLIVAAVMAFTALREGLGRRLMLSAIPAVLAVLIIVLGMIVTTAGESAREVVRQFVDDVVDNDLRAARARTAPTCVMNSRNPNLPGVQFADVYGRFNRTDAGAIVKNTITRLDACTVSDRIGDVHLACRTEFANGYTLTSWVVRVERDTEGADGTNDGWSITRITWISFMNDPAPGIDRLY
jgi:hypothetical protein